MPKSEGNNVQKPEELFYNEKYNNALSPFYSILVGEVCGFINSVVTS